MTARWLFKTEPSEFSFDDLVERGASVWDGVRNASALIHLRAVRKGDCVLVYHTGDERAIVGEARVLRGAHPDPKLDDPKLVVVELAPGKRWKVPVGLDRIKADGRFRDLGLVRMGRLSVMPVPDDMWEALVAMGAGGPDPGSGNQGKIGKGGKAGTKGRG